jgi:putative transposase
MADNSMELSDFLRKAVGGGDVNFLREGVRVLAQALMELEVSEQIGAGRHERSDERTTHRNGYRERTWDTAAGAIELKIPKVREGSYMPSLIEPRRRIDRAMLSVIQEAYVHGVSTRKVDDIVTALGMTGISKSSVSRICVELDEVVGDFLSRPLMCAYPYVWLDATYLKCREGSRVGSVAAVVAIGVTGVGEREVLGCDIGASEDGAFWTEFLRGLVARGLSGVDLVVSDAHVGLKEAIPAVLSGASWQRCRVHFMRNALTRVPKDAQYMVAAAIRTIFAAPGIEEARTQLRFIADGMSAKYPALSEMLIDAEDDVIAHMAFPREHWTKIASTNPLERVNKEIKRRTDVVGIFPNRASALRLTGCVLLEQHDEWAVGRRYIGIESMSRIAAPPSEREVVAALLAPVH